MSGSCEEPASASSGPCKQSIRVAGILAEIMQGYAHQLTAEHTVAPGAPEPGAPEPAAAQPAAAHPEPAAPEPAAAHPEPAAGEEEADQVLLKNIHNMFGEKINFIDENDLVDNAIRPAVAAMKLVEMYPNNLHQRDSSAYDRLLTDADTAIRTAKMALEHRFQRMIVLGLKQCSYISPENDSSVEVTAASGYAMCETLTSIMMAENCWNKLEKQQIDRIYVKLQTRQKARADMLYKEISFAESCNEILIQNHASLGGTHEQNNFQRSMHAALSHASPSMILQLEKMIEKRKTWRSDHHKIAPAPAPASAPLQGPQQISLSESIFPCFQEWSQVVQTCFAMQQMVSSEVQVPCNMHANTQQQQASSVHSAQLDTMLTGSIASTYAFILKLHALSHTPAADDGAADGVGGAAADDAAARDDTAVDDNTLGDSGGRDDSGDQGSDDNGGQAKFRQLILHTNDWQSLPPPPDVLQSRKTNFLELHMAYVGYEQRVQPLHGIQTQTWQALGSVLAIYQYHLKQTSLDPYFECLASQDVQIDQYAHMLGNNLARMIWFSLCDASTIHNNRNELVSKLDICTAVLGNSKSCQALLTELCQSHGFPVDIYMHNTGALVRASLLWLQCMKTHVMGAAMAFLDTSEDWQQQVMQASCVVHAAQNKVALTCQESHVLYTVVSEGTAGDGGAGGAGGAGGGSDHGNDHDASNYRPDEDLGLVHKIVDCMVQNNVLGNIKHHTWKPIDAQL